MRLIRGTTSVSWLNHNSWSGTYVGLRKLINEVLPPAGARVGAEDSALCQLAIISANQLMEIALFDLLNQHKNALTILKISKNKLENTGYYFALSELAPKLISHEINLNVEPFLSTEKLRKRRNATVHKSAALANSTMARSALYTAVAGVTKLSSLFGRPNYNQEFLRKYPIEPNVLFSQIIFPED